MSAERNPLVETSPLAAPLLAVTRRTLRMPGVVVGTAVMLAVLAILITVNGLSFKTSRLDLLNPRSEYNQRWLAYLAEFGHRDDAVIVVRADQREKLLAAIDDMAAELAREPERFESIFFRRDLSKLKTKALHFLPPEQLAGLAKQVEQAAALVPRPGMSADPAAALGQLNDRLEHLHSPEPQLLAELQQHYAQIAGMTLAALEHSSGPDSPARLACSPAAGRFPPSTLHRSTCSPTTSGWASCSANCVMIRRSLPAGPRRSSRCGRPWIASASGILRPGSD
jgi:uncharacterized protein